MQEVYWDIKKVTGTSTQRLRNSIKSAKQNFANDVALNELGLRRADTRAILDVRGNLAWDDADKVREELTRYAGSPDSNNVRQVQVITSDGIVTWTF